MIALRPLALLTLLVVSPAACTRETNATAPAKSSPSTPVASIALSAPASAPVDDTSFRFTAAGRVVAIGDLHGDAQAARRALRVAKAIDAEGRWIGGNLVVVQVGDQIDRGDEDKEVIDLFQELREPAAKAGGAVHALNGNHETMNVAGDFGYATPGGFRNFEGTGDGSVPESVLSRFEPDKRARAAAFAPRGPYARKLATREVIIVVNDSVFVHGALLPDHVRYGIARINHETRAWMKGESPRQPEIVESGRGPTWQGTYSAKDSGPEPCSTLEQVLVMVRARRMVVGHTIQQDGIQSGCDGRIWSIDVGLAEHYGPASSEILEIDGDKVRELSDPQVPNRPAIR